jgi:hypothetical protein
MKLKVPFMNYDAVAGNALDEPVRTFTFSGRLLLHFNIHCTARPCEQGKIYFLIRTFIVAGVRARIW